MTRRRVLFGLLLASAVLACFAGWLWVANARKPTRAKFEQVTKGMTREEVIRTVGGPPDNYVSEIVYLKPRPDIFGFESWMCDDGELLVFFDDCGTATDVRVYVITLVPPTLTERIRRWLGL
jgi:hypothetical protein